MRNLKFVLVVGVLKALLLVLFFSFWATTPWANHIFVDVWGWNNFYSQCAYGKIPYVDFAREYPHLVGYFFCGLAKIFSAMSSIAFLKFHTVIMLIFDLIATWLFAEILDHHRSRYKWTGIFLFQFVSVYLFLAPFRFESLLLVFILAGELSRLQKKYLLGSLFWSLGFHIKWIPLFFLAARDQELLLKEKQIRTVAYSWAIFLSVTSVIFGGALLFDYVRTQSFDQALYPYWFHIHRPIYWDTIVGVITLWWGNIPSENLFSLFSLIAMCAFVFFPKKLSFERRVILIGIAAIILNRVYSPQFHLWFYPFFVVLLTQPNLSNISRVGMILFWTLDLLTTFVYPFSFTETLIEIKSFEPFSAAQHGGIWTVLFSVAIVARAFVLALLGLWILKTKPTDSENYL